MSQAEAIHAHASAARILDRQGKADQAVAELTKATALADDAEKPAPPRRPRQ